MTRLALAELRADWRLWAGPLAVVTVTAALVGLAAMHWWSAGSPEVAAAAARAGTTVDDVRAASTTLYVCTAIAAVTVLGTVCLATVDALRTRIARWRLAGALPGQIRWAVLIQMAVLAVAGTALGSVVAAVCAEPASRVLERMGGEQAVAVDLRMTANSVATTLVATLGICVLGARRPAWRSARVPAVEAVRDAGTTRHAMTTRRWFFAAVMTLAIGAQIVMHASLKGPDQLSAGMNNSLFLGIDVTILIVILAPAGLSAVLRLWSAVLPARLSSAWFLARHSAAHQITRSSATVVPLMVGASLYGVFFGLAGTWQESLRAGGSALRLNTVDTYVVLTPVAALGAVGSIAIVCLTARGRQREFALLRAAGATSRTIVTMTVYEAVLYTTTAIVLSLAGVAATVLATAVTLSATGLPFTPTIDLRQALALCAVALAGLMAAIMVPGIAALRGDTRELLAPA
ncbi:FtsX-like permease family protein [Nonomuraea sp. NPDC003707]